MIEGVRIAVVVPAFNEQRLIGATLRSIPPYVDRVWLVDDASTDETIRAALAVGDPRVSIVSHPTNLGVGAALSTGYLRFLAEEPEGTPALCAVMAGDGQMDPEELETVLAPLLRGQADYVKGNRLNHPSVGSLMPRHRRFGSIFLSAVTRLATGYSHVSDSQCGFTAATRDILGRLDARSLYPRYGYPNDLLVRLSRLGARVVDVPVRPIYASEVSRLNPWRVGPRILWILLRARFGSASVRPAEATPLPPLARPFRAQG